MAKILYFGGENQSMKVLSALLVLLILASCGKYDDGPGLSFYSKKSRMSNHWELETATANGESWTPYYPLKEMVLNTDFSQTTTFRTLNVPNVMDGEWKWTRAKEYMELVFDSGLTQRFEIKKLKKDEMRLSIKSNDTTYVLDFITFR